MNEIRFNCPYCGQSLAVDSTNAGATVACPSCGQTILVPPLARLMTKEGMPKQFKSGWIIVGIGFFALCTAGILVWQSNRPSVTQIKPNVPLLAPEVDNEPTVQPAGNRPLEMPEQKLAATRVNAASVSSTPQLHDQDAQSAPQTEEEWKQLGTHFLEMFNAGDFSGLLHESDSIGRLVILNSPNHYLPKACIAEASNREERYQEAADFFEAALPLNPKDVHDYCDAIRGLNEYDRGFAFLHKLAEMKPNDSKQINDAIDYLSFFAIIEQGDEKYLAGDKVGALPFYLEAREKFTHIPLDPKRQDAFMAVARPQGNEYTYNRGYDTPDGVLRREYLVKTFLNPKVELCQYTNNNANHPTIVRVAIVIVRHTAFPYSIGDKAFFQREDLDDFGVAQRKAAWKFATDAVEMYSAGRIKIETQFFDLKNVTVTKIDDGNYQGLNAVIHTRHLDPAGLTPSQAPLFTQMVRFYDVIMFAWCGGAGAYALGGGPVALPGVNGPLPMRGCVKRMPGDSCDCLHEFLHNFEGRSFHDRVHGPLQPPWEIQAATYHLNDEVDWYGHLISEITNPQAMLYVKQ